MKVILFISSVFVLFISCRNEYYDNVKKENEVLRLKLDTLRFFNETEIRKVAIKEVLEEKIWTNGLIIDEIRFDRYKPINTNKFGEINKPYLFNIGLYKYEESNGGTFKFDGLLYTIPTKNRNTENQKKISSGKKYFTFVPKDTGMHYWSGAFVVINDRTGRRTEFPIYDSIYVLEN